MGDRKGGRQNWKAVAPPPISREANSRSLVRCLIARRRRRANFFYFLEFALLLFLYFLQFRLLCPFHESQKEPAKIFKVAKTEMKGKRNYSTFAYRKDMGRIRQVNVTHFPFNEKKDGQEFFFGFFPLSQNFYPPPPLLFRNLGEQVFLGTCTL